MLSGSDPRSYVCRDWLLLRLLPELIPRELRITINRIAVKTQDAATEDTVLRFIRKGLSEIA